MKPRVIFIWVGLSYVTKCKTSNKLPNKTKRTQYPHTCDTEQEGPPFCRMGFPDRRITHTGYKTKSRGKGSRL